MARVRHARPECYRASVNTSLAISGMTCNGCVKHVESALRGVEGVTAVQVKLADGSASVVHDPERSPISSLIAAVVDAGYEATCHAAPG
ncbi:MAG: heavy-metal-associated domain-containing protein [Deltaproteobacteria bacterium]|nr:heavy-metal-associated domain-containing protein [Deltaproteobacteria bacterium]